MRRTLLLLIATSLLSVACSNREAQILTTSEDIASGDWQCFHHEFYMFAPKSAELKIAADTKYWLWVNGELVVREGGLKRGPTPTDSYCDVLAEVPNLKFGKNEVVVLVQYYGKNSFSHRASATPGLYFDLTSPLDHIVSNDEWKAVRYDAMWAPATEGGEYMTGIRLYRLAGENVGYDARKALDFSKHIDSQSWPQAVAIERDKAEWGELVERPIPFWRWSELREYERVEKREEYHSGATRRSDARIEKNGLKMGDRQQYA